MEGVIKDFRDTIAFASLSASDTIDANGGETDGVGGEDARRNNQENTGGQPKGGGSTEDNKPPVLGKGVMFNITIDVLEDGHINVSNGGTLTAETFAILGEVFKLKEKHEKKPDHPPVPLPTTLPEGKPFTIFEEDAN